MCSHFHFVLGSAANSTVHLECGFVGSMATEKGFELVDCWIACLLILVVGEFVKP